MDLNLAVRTILSVIIAVVIFIAATTPMPYKLYKVGNIQIIAFENSGEELSLPQLKGLDDRADIKRAYPDPTVKISNNIFLLRIEKELCILGGLDSTERIKQCLQSVNVSPEQIEHVFLTHIHRDQIEGLMDGNKKLFPNAFIHLHDQEYQWAMGEFNSIYPNLSEYNRESISIAEKMFELYGPHVIPYISNGEEILPNVTSLPAFGHTPGHVMYLFTSDNYKLIFTGDLFLSTTSLQNPEIYQAIGSNSDISPKDTYSAREDALELINTKNVFIFSNRFSPNPLGSLDMRNNLVQLK